MGKLQLKRQIEEIKDTFCIIYRNGYRKVLLNSSKGIDSQIFDAKKENVVTPLIVIYSWSINIRVSRKSGIIAMDLRS